MSKIKDEGPSSFLSHIGAMPTITHRLNAHMFPCSVERKREGERERAGSRGRSAMLNLKLCFLLYYNSSQIPYATNGAYSSIHELRTNSRNRTRESAERDDTPTTMCFCPAIATSAASPGHPLQSGHHPETLPLLPHPLHPSYPCKIILIPTT